MNSSRVTPALACLPTLLLQSALFAFIASSCPAWAAQAEQPKPALPFKLPASAIAAVVPGTIPVLLVQVPPLIGKDRAQASATLEKAGLQLGAVSYQESAKVAETVIAQSPLASTNAKRMDKVNIVLAKPPAAPPPASSVIVPSLIGLTPTQAQETLLKRTHGQLTLASPPTYQESNAPVGTVVKQSPAAGAQITLSAAGTPGYKAGMQQVGIVLAKLPISTPPKTTSVPNVTGMPQQKALAWLKEYQLNGVVIGAKPAANLVNQTVLTQAPGPGTKVKPNSEVQLVLVKNIVDASVTVPNLIDLDIHAAQLKLSQSELGMSRQMRPSAQPAGLVLDQKPAAGSSVSRKSEVLVWVSDGSLTRVPRLIGKSRQDALALLSQRGLSQGSVNQRPAAGAADIVLDQAPAENTELSKGSSVSVTLSRLAKVPKLIDKPVSAINGALKAELLRPGQLRAVSSARPKGMVLGQQPAAGSAVAVNSEVHIEYSAADHVLVPELGKLSEAEAALLLRQNSLILG